MTEPADRTLILRSRQGASSAYGELVRRYQRSVFAVCYRLMKNRQDAEDMVQDAFMRGFDKLHTYDEERPFGPWIRQVATRVCLNQLKKRRSNIVQLDEEFDMQDPDLPTPEERQAALESSSQLQAAILELPEHFRTVIELRHVQQLSYDEIATQLDLPLNTIKSHLFRARKKLAERLKTI